MKNLKNLNTVLSQIAAAFIVASCTPSLNPEIPQESSEPTEQQEEVTQEETSEDPEVIKTPGKTVAVTIKVWYKGNELLYPDKENGGFSTATEFELSEPLDSVRAEVVLTGFQYVDTKVVFDEGSRTKGHILISTHDKAVVGGTLMLRVTEAGETVEDNWNESNIVPIETAYLKLSSNQWNVPSTGGEGYELTITTNCGYDIAWETYEFVRITDFDNDTLTMTLKAFAARTTESKTCRLIIYSGNHELAEYFTIVEDGLPETFTSIDGTFEFQIADWEDDDDESVNF